MAEFEYLPSQFQSHGGNCWKIDLPHVPAGDGAGPFPSSLQLYEDGLPLGAAHTSHEEIRHSGLGRFSHWGAQLYFSASDNSNSNTNNRSYAISIDYSKTIEQIAETALSDVATWLWHLGDDYDFVGKTVCEIGPGDTLAASLVLLGLGAECVVVDRVMPTWDAFHHPLLIDEICRKAPRLARPFYTDRLLRCCSEADFCFACIYNNGLESAEKDLRDMADLTLSASALEHVENFGRSAEALHSIMRVGGFGVHCIDMRDHHNFERPFEFLLYSQEEYDACRMAYKYSRGNRVRPNEIMNLVNQAGFFASRFVGFLESKVDYRADVQQRLSVSNSPLRSVSSEDLIYLNGVLRLAKL